MKSLKGPVTAGRTRSTSVGSGPVSLQRRKHSSSGASPRVRPGGMSLGGEDASGIATRLNHTGAPIKALPILSCTKSRSALNLDTIVSGTSSPSEAEPFPMWMRKRKDLGSSSEAHLSSNDFQDCSLAGRDTNGIDVTKRMQKTEALEEYTEECAVSRPVTNTSRKRRTSSFQPFKRVNIACNLC